MTTRLLGHPYTGPYLDHWVTVGHANPWIHDAMDPPFASHRFTAFDTDLEAIQTLLRRAIPENHQPFIPAIDLINRAEIVGKDERFAGLVGCSAVRLMFRKNLI